MFYCGFYSANVYAVSASGQKMVQKRHSDVYKIETTIKHDINVSITPPFLQGYLSFSVQVLFNGPCTQLAIAVLNVYLVSSKLPLY
jgi:hypothetical protein